MALQKSQHMQLMDANIIDLLILAEALKNVFTGSFSSFSWGRVLVFLSLRIRFIDFVDRETDPTSFVFSLLL